MGWVALMNLELEEFCYASYQVNWKQILQVSLDHHVDICHHFVFLISWHIDTLQICNILNFAKLSKSTFYF